MSSGLFCSTTRRRDAPGLMVAIYRLLITRYTVKFSKKAVNNWQNETLTNTLLTNCFCQTGKFTIYIFLAGCFGFFSSEAQPVTVVKWNQNFIGASATILAQLRVFARRNKGLLKVNMTAGEPHMWDPCVLVPWAQLQPLMVCTGESLQWLPPHGPLNTSGHMVCSVGRERVSRTEPDSSIHSQT